MKPNFALSLSIEGLRLMHRVTGGWHLVGQVALDDDDLPDALAHLKRAAETLEPDGISTKILIPNDQIRYLALDNTRAEDAEVRQALDGATPYSVSDLTYDYVKGGGRTYIAAVAKDTLFEAEQFATEHDFNPVCFAAVPEAFTYVGEAFFGAVDGKSGARDDEPVVVIGHSKAAVATRSDRGPSDAAITAPTLPSSNPAPETKSSATTPMFASRMERSADKSTIPAASHSPAPTPDPRTSKTSAKSPAMAEVPAPFKRAEPTLGRPSLTGATGADTTPIPPIDPPNRAADVAPDAPAQPDTSTTALPISAARAAASLNLADEIPEPVQEMTPFGAIPTGGPKSESMFLNRRKIDTSTTPKVPEEASETETAKKSTATVARTVFGGRKKSDEKTVIGGKPRFLGLILTTILLLFLLVIAAFAALSEEGIARWLGFGAPEAQIAAEDVPNANTTPIATVIQPAQPPIAPEGARVLAPDAAARIYAATGVWQRSATLPAAPRTTNLDKMSIDVATRPVDRIPALSALVPADTVKVDTVIAPPIDPPAPDVTFAFNADGVIPATPQGAPTPDGVLIIAGTPDQLPPVRPGTRAPVITPQERIAAITPQDAVRLPAPDGVIVFEGAPTLTPPVRPAQTPTEQSAPAADTIDSAVQSLRDDVTTALTSGTAQAPTAATPRPLIRPVAAAQTADAASVQANTTVETAEPVDVIAGQVTSVRPLLRPASLAPRPESPNADVDRAVAQVLSQPAADAAPTLQISPEIAAAVLAATNRPDAIVNPTAQAVAASTRPDARPRNMARIVERATTAQQRAPTQTAAQTTQRVAATIAPSGPTATTVARAATLDNAINLRDINLIGIFGGTTDRRALVRLGNGRLQRVSVGDRLDGGRVSAISAQALRYTKRGRDITLQVAG